MWDIPMHPPQASTFATEIDYLYFALWGLTILFSTIVGVMIFVFTTRYKRGTKANRARPVDHHYGLELTWSIIPLILGLVIFAWGAKLYADVYKVPDNATEIFVIGKQWMWHLQHTNGTRENNELHVPVGRPIKLTMISQDVIHSFFVPAFRIKRDVLPGTYSTVWFQPTLPGKYHLFCAEYCGTEHSRMGGYVYVMEPADFQRWLDTKGAKPGDYTMKPPTVPPTMVDQGADLYQSVGCANCHGAEDTKRGPSLYGIYGTKRKIQDGRTFKADRTYLREAILKPNEKLTAGYDPLMPTYENQLTEEQVNQLVEYIKSLGMAAEPARENTQEPGSKLIKKPAAPKNNASPPATSAGSGIR